MKKATTIAILTGLFLLGSALTVSAQTGEVPGADRYRWTEEADGSSRLWRQAASHPDVWEPAGSIPATVLQVVASAASPDTAYARTRFDLYVTESQGAIWRKMPRLPGIPTVLDVGQQTPGLLYLGTSDLGAFRSDDGGATWRRLEGLGLQPGTILDASALAVNPADEHIVFVAVGYWTGSTTMHYSPLGIFASVNGGASWLPLYEAPMSGDRIEHLFAEDTPSLTVQAVTAADARWYTFSDIELLAVLLQTGTPAERAGAAKALALVLPDYAANALLARLVTETDPAVGQAIAQALGPLAQVKMMPALLAALQHDDPYVRWRAATVLGYLPNPVSIRALGWVVRNDNSIARHAASGALIRIGTAAAAQEVLALLDTPVLDSGRHVALATLEGIGDPAVDPLTQALADGSTLLRQNAAEALGWIASPRAVEALATALNDENEMVRMQAAWALHHVGTTEAREALVASIPLSRAANNPSLPTAWPWLALMVGGAVAGRAYARATRQSRTWLRAQPAPQRLKPASYNTTRRHWGRFK